MVGKRFFKHSELQQCFPNENGIFWMVKSNFPFGLAEITENVLKTFIIFENKEFFAWKQGYAMDRNTKTTSDNIISVLLLLCMSTYTCW